MSKRKWDYMEDRWYTEHQVHVMECNRTGYCDMLIDHPFVACYAHAWLRSLGLDVNAETVVLSRTYADIDNFSDEGVRLHRLPKDTDSFYWGEGDVGEPIILEIVGDSRLASELGHALIESGVGSHICHVAENIQSVTIESRGFGDSKITFNWEPTELDEAA